MRASRQEGERAAAVELLGRVYDQVFAICRRICAGRADGEDATQEALISIARALPGFDGRSAVTLRAPEGGWSAVLRLPATDTDEGWARTLLSRGVVVHPGYLFDATSETCVVLSLIVDPGVFAAGIEALREAVDGSG